MNHWSLQRDVIATLQFHRADHAVNSINSDVLSELASVLTSIDQDPEIQGLIILSHRDRFCVGADLHAIEALYLSGQLSEFIQQGQNVFQQLEQLTIPTVAVIVGDCLGGGLELALACRYRIALDDPKTRLGLPEVMLGIHPGWGGTVRLPRLIGASAALKLMLSGKIISVRQAKKLGMIDCFVPQRHLETAALFYARSKAKPKKKCCSVINLAWIRPIFAHFIRTRLQKKVNVRHYPAPFSLLNHWERVGVHDRNSFSDEAQSVLRLASTQTAQNLLRVAFLRQRLKSSGNDSGIAPIQKVHVIGLGEMGSAIAAWCVLKGFSVTVQDQEPQSLARVHTRAFNLAKQRLQDDRLVCAAMDRLILDPSGYGVHQSDLIIEAVFEDLQVKRDLFSKLEGQIKSHALLATNTSSIPLEQIQAILKKPERLVGLHFFNPVAKMPLVEVIRSLITSDESFARALNFVQRIGKLPLPVKSAPGFLVNRLLVPYLMQAIVLVQEGMPAHAIDQALVEFGMPVGPLTLTDNIGLDLCCTVGKILKAGTIPSILEEKIKQGYLGRKTGRGFYRYRNGKQLKEDRQPHVIKNNIAKQLIDCMWEEAQDCLSEKIVQDRDLLDAGVLFGIGFPPFRGGLAQFYAQQGEARSN
jgi:3-hydroxyacyl-CoA dehydrogenase / enoyl-CoA hydratase / 3-hydroxybutyryl-CoA epimerase